MPTRREVLAGAAAGGALATLGLSPGALAGADGEPRLVVLILRGGADGLSLVPAPGDPGFFDVRAGMMGGEDGVPLPLDGFFALHPGLRGLMPLWQAGQLTVVHATQTGYRGRSHFDAQDLLENGLNGVSGLADGWLNRALGWFGQGGPPRGLAAGSGTPLILQGATPVATWAPRRLPEAAPGFLAELLQLSAGDALLGPALAEGVRTAGSQRALLGELAVHPRGDSRSRQALTRLAEATGRLLSATPGPRVAALELGGWDSHGYQQISLFYRVPYLNDMLVALKRGLGPAWSDTAVVVASEFGRTVAINGTNGTDHGTAGVALLLGGAVSGGQVIADWPGVRPNDRFEGRDLKSTIDLRSVFKGLMIEHLGIDQAFVEARVFPDSPRVRAIEGLVRA